MKQSAQLKSKTPLRRFSAKRKRDYARYLRLRKAHLETYPTCQVAIPEVCTGQANQIHHRAGRYGQLNSLRHFMSTCQECHTWIHRHGAEARRRGLIFDKP